MASNQEGTKFPSDTDHITNSLTQELRSPLLANPQNKGYVDDGVETLDYTEDPSNSAFYQLLVDVDPLETLTPPVPTIPQIVTYVNNMPAGITIDQIYGTTIKSAMLTTSEHEDSYPRHNQYLEILQSTSPSSMNDGEGNENNRDTAFQDTSMNLGLISKKSQRGFNELSSFLAALTPKHRLHALNMKMGSITMDHDGTYLADSSLGDSLTELMRSELQHALGIEYIQYLDYYGVQRALSAATNASDDTTPANTTTSTTTTSTTTPSTTTTSSTQSKSQSQQQQQQSQHDEQLIDLCSPSALEHAINPQGNDDDDDKQNQLTNQLQHGHVPRSLSMVAYDTEITLHNQQQNQILQSYREPMFEPLPPPLSSSHIASSNPSSPYFNEFDKSDKLYLVGVDAPMDKSTYADIEFLTSFWPQLTRFVICFFAGCCIATLAYFTEYFIGILNNFLYWIMASLLQQEGGVIGYSSGLSWLWPSLAIIASTMVVVCYLTVGVTLVYWGGLYALRGSGLPPLNAYLDGTYDPSIPLFGTKIMISKILSVSLALGGMVKGGLQGPLIHVGAMVARMVSKQTLKILRTKPCIFALKNLCCCCHREPTICCRDRGYHNSLYPNRSSSDVTRGYLRQYNTEHTHVNIYDNHQQVSSSSASGTDSGSSSHDPLQHQQSSSSPSSSSHHHHHHHHNLTSITNTTNYYGDDDDEAALRLMQEHMRGKMSLNAANGSGPNMPVLVEDLESEIEYHKNRIQQREQKNIARQQHYVIGNDDQISGEIANRLSILAHRANIDVPEDYNQYYLGHDHQPLFPQYNDTNATRRLSQPTQGKSQPQSTQQQQQQQQQTSDDNNTTSQKPLQYKYRVASRAKTSQVSGGTKNNDYTEHKKLTFAQKIEVLCRSLSGPGDEHDFLACGAASGFACAFNAPLAGMIMVQSMIKQAVSFQLTLRLFFTTLVSVIVTNLFDSDQSILPDRGFVDLDIPPSEPMPVAELFLTALLGLLGGLLGVFVIKVNLILQTYRLRLYRDRFTPNLQYTILLSLLVIIPGIVFSLSTSCSPISEESFPVCIDHPSRCLRLACPEGHFSQLGTFFFNAPSQFLRLVWDRSNNENNEFNMVYLVSYMVIYLLLASASFMAAFPGGFFLPSILLGGMYGRILARLVNHFAAPYTLNTGIYATLGSVALLSAINRLTTPSVVMMVEFTSDVQFLTPIMIVIICSKFVADFIIGGLEQEVGKVQVKSQYVALGESPHPSIAHITAKDILSINTNLLGYPEVCQNDELYPGQSDLAVIGEIDSIHRINAILATTTHSSFPVVSVLPGHLMHCEHLQAGAKKMNEYQQQTGGKIPHSPNDLHKYFTCTCNGTKLQTGRLLGLITRRALHHIVEKSVDYTRATKIVSHDYHHSQISTPSSSKKKKDPFRINSTETHPDALTEQVRSRDGGREPPSTTAANKKKGNLNKDNHHHIPSSQHNDPRDSNDINPSCSCLRCVVHRWPVIRFHNPILALLHHSMSKKTLIPLVASIYFQLVRHFNHSTYYHRFAHLQHRRLLLLVQQRELLTLTMNIVTNMIRLPVLPLHIRSVLSRLSTKKHSLGANPTIGVKGNNNINIDEPTIEGGINNIINHRDEFNDDPAFISPLVKLISWLEERSMVRTSLNNQPIKRADLSNASSSVGITATSLCVSLVNTLPLTDFGIYVVSDATPGNRVWRQFRTVGMAKVVVINEHNAPIGVITRKDVVRADKHCSNQMALFKKKLRSKTD